MNEQDLRDLAAAVRAGRVSRRAFVQRMVGLGLTAPFAARLLAASGMAQMAAPAEYKPTKAGGGGSLKVLFWQAPTLLNPHFAVGTKDQEGARIFYEPLAAWDRDGNLVPVLAAEIPEIENGGVAPDGLSVIWKLKKDVQWHDGQPFTADDVVFNWEYAADPATAATTIGSYRNVTVEKVDPLTVRVRFSKPTPFWASAFVGQFGMIIPKHLFEPYKGASSRDAPENLKPVGTGPYRFVEFRPGDLVKGERNPSYHLPNRPYFDAIEMKGGGDAVSAARAVIQTGEYDYAWNLQVEDEILLKLEGGSNAKGRVEIVPGGNIEHIELNNTDPWTDVDGERSSIKTKHPLFSDPAVRKALTLLVDRASIEAHIYGRTGLATGNFINNPPRFVSKNTHWEFNIEKANQMLEQAGWRRGTDGIRAKDNKKLKLVFQTSINAPRQKTQAIVKQACQKAGIDMELKSITASVYFSSDVANPDTYAKFYADMQMFTTTMGEPDPGLFMRQFLSTEIASKDNKWQGRNITRWRNEEYDKAFHAAEGELDPIKRAALFIEMNEMVVGDPTVIPVVYRPGVSALSRRLRANLSGWDNVLWDLRNWYRET
ncbi:MAG: peptide ABC transporter substrate-binding protein [Alphaproteobacteria bacterium]|nr:peptide ABC transporter substrate-binding protein [Alphaproteobacteria bacterium]MBV9373908.1 peptide ABC transporter substrate-binding protein [Alphaproteobacteria bacterium]